jgi:hypothetical protein
MITILNKAYEDKIAEVANIDSTIYTNFSLSVKNSEIFDVETVDGPHKIGFDEHGMYDINNASWRLE